MSYEDPQGFYIPSAPPPPLPPAGFGKRYSSGSGERGNGGPNNNSSRLNTGSKMSHKGLEARVNKNKSGGANKQQSVYTIPGYVPYNANHQQLQHEQACTPQEVGINFKGVDNPAFHHQEVNNKVPPPPLPPLRETTLSKNVNCTHNMMLGTYSTPSSTDTSSLDKSSCCKKWTLHLMPSAKNRKCAVLSVLILAIILLVAALVVILYLTVGGGMDLVSSNKPDSLHKGNLVIDGTFRIVSVAFDLDLNNPSSKLYEILRLEVSQAILLLFNRSSISSYYNRSDVLGFRNGSVVVDIRVFLSSPVEDAASKITSAFVKGLVNMHGTVLLDKFVIDIRSIYFKVDESLEEALLNSMAPSNSLTSPVNPNLTHPQLFIDSFKPVKSGATSSSAATRPLNGTVTNSSKEEPSSTGTPISTTSRPGPNSFHPNHVNAVPSSRPPVPTTTTTSPIPITTTTIIPKSPPVPPFTPPFPPISGRPRNPFNSTLTPGRPIHPFLRPPPPISRLPTSSHLPRSGLHLQIDFADSPGWSEWSEWNKCGNGACPPNQNSTQMRTRVCRTLNGTGEVLSNNRECLMKGGNYYEMRRCSCDEKRLALASRFTLPDVVITTEKANATGRPCYECLSSEICLAKHNEKEASCKSVLDSKDETGCGGWCNAQHEYCQHMSSGAKRCIDDRVCLPNEWQCGDGLCIPADKRCDGHFNCYDTTDELNCKCEENYIRCGKNTSCLPPQKRCNRIIDCWDGSDEENCTKQCPPGKFTCNNGQCIQSLYFCDGFVDCQDSSDEPEGCKVSKCAESEFRCHNGRCIPLTYKCDGRDTCGDRTDETNCPPLPDATKRTFGY